MLAINNQLGKDSIVRGYLERTGLETFLFNGQFDEINANWYGQVGMTIALTCFLNTVLPFANCCFFLQKLCNQCLDRGCTRDHRNTKKLVQEDYEQLYTGGVF